MNMTPELLVAIINLISRVGLSVASVFLQRVNKPSPTLDDAIAALDEASKKSAQDYLDQAKKTSPA